MPQKLAVVFFFNFNKFVFPNSQGSAATQLRCGGKYYLYFVENFMRFPAVKKLWKFVKIWQSYNWLQSSLSGHSVDSYSVQCY